MKKKFINYLIPSTYHPGCNKIIEMESSGCQQLEKGQEGGTIMEQHEMPSVVTEQIYLSITGWCLLRDNVN